MNSELNLDTKRIIDDFNYEVFLPSRWIDGLGWSATFILGIWLSTIFITGSFFENLVIKLIFVLIFVLIGLGFGKLWIYLGKILSNNLVINPLKQFQSVENKNDLRMKWFLHFYLGKDIHRVFLHFKVEDLNLKSKLVMVTLTLRIIVTYVSFLFVNARILQLIGLSDFVLALIFSFLITIPLIGFYFPFSLIVKDGRVMISKEDGSVELAGGNVIRRLDGFFGIAGLLSGFQYYNEEVNREAIENIIFFLFFVIVMLLLAFPILFPALYIYYRGHTDLVNNYRNRLLDLSIFPARTSTQPLTSEEIQYLTLGEVRKGEEIQPKSIFGKIKKQVVGPVYDKPIYSEQEKENIKRTGGWICNRCGQTNSSRENSICSNCNKESTQF